MNQHINTSTLPDQQKISSTQHAVSPAAGHQPATLNGNARDAPGLQTVPFPFIQFKLSIGAVDDPLEDEADAMADQVMRMPADHFIQRCSCEEGDTSGEKLLRKPADGFIQRCSTCDEEEKVQRKPISSFIQRKESSAGAVASNAVSSMVNNSRGNGSQMDSSTQTFMQSRFGADFSNVKIHTGNEATHLNRELNAKAFTVGRDVYFNEGEYNPGTDKGKHLLAHELTHTIQQSGTVLKAPLVQRAIRIDNGKKRIKEKEYKAKGAKAGVGTKFKVQDLLKDKVKRVFKDEAEVENYANGATDYIGDIKPQDKSVYWYRLPENDLTVLGETHNNAKGNAEDVIVGLNTKRFMYEPFHEFNEVAPTGGSVGKGISTTTALQANEKKYLVSPLIDYAKFSPALESIVIKAFTGASMYKDFLGTQSDARWASRKSESDYSFGDRIALYFSAAMHIASDISGYTFPAAKSGESHYNEFGRSLQAFYTKNKTVLDTFSATKDADKLIGIADMFKKFSSPQQTVLSDFADLFEKFAAGYIEELGVKTGNTELTKQGKALFAMPAKGLMDFNPAREEIMKERIKTGKAGKYIIAGMGDAHHANLTTWLDANGIPHEEVVASLKRQQSDIAGKWVK